MNRRNFIQSMTACGSYLALSPSISIANDLQNSQEKSVIFVFLSGGIAATEFINPVPNAPVEFRSVRNFVEAKGDYLLGGDFKNLASIGDELTVVRNFHHRDANHSSATHWTMTGEPGFQSTDQKWPSHGSLLSHEFGPLDVKKGIPNYVRTRPIQYDESAWLGASHIGMTADENGVGNLFPRVPEDRFDRRMEVMRTISKQSKLSGPIAQGWYDLKNQAADIIKGKAGAAFDLSKEAPENVKKYNADSSRFGKDLLLARRLVQAGVKYITINNGGWDNHNNIETAFSTKGPELDTSLFVLLNDLKGLGLLDNTLLVVTSEFSRTPKVNKNAGRDHYPSLNSLMFAGGGYDHGRVIGETDGNASQVVGQSYDPKDLSWTIMDHFGVEKNLVIVDNSARPRHMFRENAKNILLDS
jgi:hypothetical protein